MATAIIPLEKLQVGMESSPGTLVAADFVLPVETGGEFMPEIDRPHLDESQGVAALVDHIDVRKGVNLRYRHALDYENILLPSLCGLKSTTPVSNGVETWTFNPDPTTIETLLAATFEVSYTDGSTRHLQTEFGFGTCRSFTIDIAYNQPAFLEAEFFGRHAQSSTFTADQSVLSRDQIPSNLFTLDIDSSWSSLGDTQAAGVIRSARLEVTTGAEPDYTLDGRSDLDLVQLRRGMLLGELTMTLEYNATGDTEYDAWVANTRRFMRLSVDGPSSKTLDIDMSLRYTQPPRFREEDGLRVMEIVGELVYDPTSTEVLNITVANALASF